jgi:hypothetical protein
MGFLASTCAICSGPITPETPVIGTSGCAFPESHHLWQYCDTQLHQACLADWRYRSEFSAGYFGIRIGGHVLHETEEWRLCSGPVQYGPHGKVRLPYYAEIRLREWPVRLYSRFEEWDDFISSRKWQATSIPALNYEIEKFLPHFPASSAELEALLLPSIMAMLELGQDHRTRYVAVLALHLFGEKANIAEPLVKLALNDGHGSVRQAAHILLKSFQVKDSVKDSE